MSRISFVPTSEWSEELRTFVAADSATELELGITRMLAHAPELAMGLLGFGGALTTKRTLPERLIEFLRLRVAFHNQCRPRSAVWSNLRTPSHWTTGSALQLSWAIDSPVITYPSTRLFLGSLERSFRRLKSWSY